MMNIDQYRDMTANAILLDWESFRENLECTEAEALIATVQARHSSYLTGSYLNYGIKVLISIRLAVWSLVVVGTLQIILEYF